MNIEKYLEVIWMNLIGIGFVSVGLYMIIFLSAGNAIFNPMGFILMVMGLFFSTIGGFYGKKKLLAAENPVSIESRQIDQLKQNVVSQVMPVQIAVQEKPELKQVVQAKPQVIGIQSAETQPGQVVKVMVCPGCDTENPPSNMFCFNCGKRLKVLPKKMAASKFKKTSKAS